MQRTPRDASVKVKSTTRSKATGEIVPMHELRGNQEMPLVSQSPKHHMTPQVLKT